MRIELAATRWGESGSFDQANTSSGEGVRGSKQLPTSFSGSGLAFEFEFGDDWSSQKLSEERGTVELQVAFRMWRIG